MSCGRLVRSKLILFGQQAAGAQGGAELILQRMLDGLAVQGLFHPPRYLRRAASADVPPFTLADGADYIRDVLGG